MPRKIPDSTKNPLCRLRYLGSATTWGFAIYRASHDDYEDNVLPTGSPTGTAEEALDCACGLYLANQATWALDPRRFNDEDHQLLVRRRPAGALRRGHEPGSLGRRTGGIRRAGRRGW